MVLKLSSQENPQRTKNVPKNKMQNQKWFQKGDLELFFGFNKESFWFSFLEPFQEVLKRSSLLNLWKWFKEI